jgi:hypothetical protein
MAIVGHRLLNRPSRLRIAKAAVAAAAMAAVLVPLEGLPLPAQVLLGATVFLTTIVVLRLPTADEWATARRLAQRARTSLTRVRAAK